jgi:hypothetical protein
MPTWLVAHVHRQLWHDDDAQSAQHGVGGGDRRLDGRREGEHGRHPWTTTHLPDMVESTILQ